MEVQRLLIVSTTLLGLLALTPALSRADDFGGPMFNIPLYVELAGTGGYSFASGQGLSQTTNLIQLGGSATIGALFGNTFFVGVNTSYQSIQQSSSVIATDGNFSGSRWNVVAPTIGFRFSSFVVEGNYQPLGDYRLSNPSATGANLSYSGVSGFRATVLYNLYGVIHVGAFYENLSFSQLVNSVSGTTNLSPSLSTGQFGVTAALVF